MRRRIVLLSGSFWVAIAAGATANTQVNAADAPSRFAEVAAVTALDFRQGQVASLLDAKPMFTAAGWADYLKRLNGWVDHDGAPTFSSTFTPSGPAIGTKQDKENLTVTVPGILKHESRNAYGGVSSTAYRAEIDISVSPGPFKIDLLVQRTCGGATTKPSCR